MVAKPFFPSAFTASVVCQISIWDATYLSKAMLVTTSLQPPDGLERLVYL